MFLKYLTPDRRRRQRQYFNSSVRVLAESGSIEALGINISDVGMALFAVANLQVGSLIELELFLPESPEPTRMMGTVRHRALYLYGIEFQTGRQPEHAPWEAQVSETSSHSE